MRYRKLSPTGDYVFGHGLSDFYHNQVEAVGQAIQTKLLLFMGEWFADTSAGTPWGGFPLNNYVLLQGKILGKYTDQIRDIALRTAVLQVQGVISIPKYSSSVVNRAFSAQMTVTTMYGNLNLSISPNASLSGFEIGYSPLDSNVPIG